MGAISGTMYQLMGRTAKRIGLRWIPRHSSYIRHGVGKGLRFNFTADTTSYTAGSNERPVQDVLAKHLAKGATFYDIGANVGFFTVIGAKLVGPQGHVYAFEPVADNVVRLKENVAANQFNNVTALAYAVAAQSGPGVLTLAEHCGGATLADFGVPPDATTTIRVRVVAIDQLVQSRQIAPPDVVKIDVEGAELAVLQGMQATIAQCKPIILWEIDDRDRSRLQQKAEACKALIQMHGYAITELADAYADFDWEVRHYVAVPA